MTDSEIRELFERFIEATEEATEARHRQTDVMDGIRKDIAKLVESGVGK